MSEALITPDVLTWARQRAEISLEQLADKLTVQVEKIQKWEKGENKPTFVQAQKIAKIFQIPFGYLFLQTPPEDKLPIPDLRTFKNEPIGELSPEFKSLLNDILLKQKWYKDYILENDGDEIYVLAWPTAHVMFKGRGETLLVAAMRCYVSSVLGEEVEVPDELI